MIDTPHFLNSRRWTLDNLRPFDRQAYIDALLVQYPAIPEEFRIWILEWPGHLAVACMWPGLPFIDCRRANAMRRYGVNWLGYKGDSPELLAVIYKQKTPDVKFVPGLLVWRAYTFTEWLIFDEDEPSLFGRVYVTDFMELESSAVIPHERQPKPEDYDYPESVYLDPQGDREFTERGPYNNAEEPVDSEGYLNVPYADWICYLEHQWALSVGNFQNVGELHPYRDKAIPEPVKTVFDQSGAVDLPTFPWSSRLKHTEHLHSR
ncbi:hypothetical protein CVT25_000913 [Psilocybe cyanescens]|uniref:Uncharacterized protein n=1 Tax=Psilocybe cyanescens TaxID=93625 RepID=A0A409WZ93_PSICY|nr:hypothetical protein CVT25_000913 [Psilocybe cyanescens]